MEDGGGKLSLSEMTSDRIVCFLLKKKIKIQWKKMCYLGQIWCISFRRQYTLCLWDAWKGCIFTHSTLSEIEQGGLWFVTAIDPPLPLFPGNNLAAFQKEVIARLSVKKLSLNVEALDIYCPIIATLFWNNIIPVTGSFQNNLLCPNGFQAWVCLKKDCPCSIN